MREVFSQYLLKNFTNLAEEFSPYLVKKFTDLAEEISQHLLKKVHRSYVIILQHPKDIHNAV
jgi:hypothetical protein